MSLTSFIKFCKRKVGVQHVVVDSPSLREAETATFPTRSKVLAIIKPASRSEVIACVKAANRYDIPLYAISKGKNWGYGSRVPSSSKSVIIDLSRLNRIVKYDEVLGYVVVEPGVTQIQLSRFLEEKGGKFWVDPVSSSPETSIVGNVLERGHGNTAYADHISYACSYEAVLPTGQCISSTSALHRNSRTSNLEHFTVGPSLEGLFSQSNFGVVTKMTLWLMPAPSHYEVLFFSVDTDKAVGKIIDLLRPLRMNRTLQFGPRVVNNYRIIQASPMYLKEMPISRPISKKEIRLLSQKLEIPLWSISLPLYGSLAQIKVNERLIVKTLKSVKKSLKIYRGSMSRHPRVTNHQAAMFSSMIGKVPSHSMQPYWRKPSRMKITNPDHDRCGFILLPISVPNLGSDVFRCYNIIKRMCLAHQFEPSVAFIGIRERTIHIYLSIVYDRDSPKEEAQALKCSNSIVGRLSKFGYYPVRLGLHSMDLIKKSEKSYIQLIRKIKETLDPKSILADGRYMFG